MDFRKRNCSLAKKGRSSGVIWNPVVKDVNNSSRNIKCLKKNKSGNKPAPSELIAAQKQHDILEANNYKLRLRLKHVRETTFMECAKILDSVMAYCDAKAKATGRAKSIPGEGVRPGAGCGGGLCGGYTPSGWNKLKLLGAMDCCNPLPDCSPCTSLRSRPECPQSSSTGNTAGCSSSTFRPSLHLLGEMAFQLERRILDYVFGVEGAKKRRFYGYTVSNICYMMEKESTCPDGDSDVVGRTEMTCRLRKILCALEKYGYDIKVHADFAQEEINKYGLLPCPPDKKTIQCFGLNDPCTIHCLISRLVKGQAEIHNLNVLLNCLHFLSKCDERPLFVW